MGDIEQETSESQSTATPIDAVEIFSQFSIQRGRNVNASSQSS
jgi:hypothetical protein